MEKVDELIKMFQLIIALGGIARVIQCITVVAIDSDEGQKYKTRIKNIIYFCIISSCVLEIMNLAQKYFSV